MFNKSNFCHIASNNRNEQKGSVFIYKTADTLAQVTQSGYFNEKLIDINVHDLIIHVQYNPVDRTLKKSVLIVTERTLDNVETTPILDQTICDDIADLGDQVQGIEEKIPGSASATNQLVTKEDLENIDALPDQSGNSGKFLTTDGTTASWSDKPIVNNASVNGAVAIGTNAEATQNTAVSVGNKAKARNSLATAIGADTQASSLHSTAIGGGAIVTNSYAVQIGKGTNTEHGTVCFGNKNGNFTMMSADGTIPADRISNLDFGTMD